MISTYPKTGGNYAIRKNGVGLIKGVQLEEDEVWLLGYLAACVYGNTTTVCNDVADDVVKGWKNRRRVP
ncbi:hypothetical protein LCGC14_2276340 [marine sediment metagenome]|uniref:Uncharacterized protein n=1 Tax=marine sediment metagenome TaxID=412755 RepID=A0A0F9DHQ6_9ZZZZ